MKRFVVFFVAVATAAAMLEPFPATVRADDGVPFKGSAELTLTSVTGTLTSVPGTLVLTYDGTGEATQLGLFIAHAEVFPYVTPSGNLVYSGTAVFTAANGDQVSFNVGATFTSPTTTVGGAMITGGTGRFMDATGEVDYVEVFSDTTHTQVELTFEGTIEF